MATRDDSRTDALAIVTKNLIAYDHATSTMQIFIPGKGSESGVEHEDFGPLGHDDYQTLRIRLLLTLNSNLNWWDSVLMISHLFKIIGMCF